MGLKSKDSNKGVPRYKSSKHVCEEEIKDRYFHTYMIQVSNYKSLKQKNYIRHH